MKNQLPDEGAEVIAFRDAAAFDRWLERNGGTKAGVWLKLAKKGSDIPSMTSDEAVDVGLCHGWISGQRRSLDESYYLQKYVPRRPHSRWSQVNVAKVEELTAAGPMRPAGRAEVDAAKADGRWEAAYVAQRDAIVPPALTASPAASTALAALGKTDQYAVILSLETARTGAVRARRLDRALARLTVGDSPGSSS